MWPAEWRVVDRGPGLPREAIRRGRIISVGDVVLETGSRVVG